MARCNEIDAVRGILLLIMAITHLPTGLNAFTDQPLGFVSAAEGFVFLSAFLVGSTYSPLLLERGLTYVRRTLWKRAHRLYGFHLGLLLFMFTIVAGIAEISHSKALHNHLLFFFHSPGWAMLSASLLIYQPPLLDILPMYIVFLAVTPVLLQLALRRGWWLVLSLSGLLWLFAQMHANSGWLYDAVFSTGVSVPLPRDAWSAFDWLAWQLVWTSGLWLGARRRRRQDAHAGETHRVVRPFLMAAAVIATLTFLWLRHRAGGAGIHLDINSPLVNKWKLGPLRVANFAALAFVISRALLPWLRLLRIAMLELLGRTSLQVFTAHIPVCILADGLCDLTTAGPTLLQQALLVVVMFGVMLLVAWRSDGPRRRAVPATLR